MSVNRLILGDNINIMKTMESETIDLIYLDPPFFSNRNYEVIWGDDGEVRSFQDRWAGGVEHYIAWLKERVIEMHRILKSTGSIFLHCDWHADAYIRCDILDKIFGDNNFRGQIIWKRYAAHSLGTKNMDMISDSIYFYSKSNTFTYNVQYGKKQDMKADGITERFPRIEPETGRRFQDVALEQSSNKSSKDEKRIIQGKEVVAKMGWRWTQETFDQRIKENPYIIYWTKTGRPRFKVYADEYEGLPMGNVWDDIPAINTMAKERIGYPTQKPEALLHRIIECASNEGDLVLDPFVGGGTTIIVADKLNRKWIGIDQSVAAIKVSDLRLKNRHDLYSQPYDLQLRTYDYDLLRNQNAFAFEKFIIEQFGGIPNLKQRNDFGLDGRMPDNTPIQVKRSDNIGRNVIDNFFAAVQRSDKKLFEKKKADGKTVGYIIAFSFGKGAIEEVARLKNKEHIIIELKKVNDIVTYGKPPKVTLTANELEQYKYAFEATAESETGIEFYSWDFNHKPEDGFKADIYLDKEGKQVRKLIPGEHQIAIEAVDKSGLDGTDKIKLKVNGRKEI